MVLRLDRSVALGALKRNGSGGLIVPANVARTGIQIYHQDGREIREYRPPEEVFDAESLESLGGVSVTVGHPPKGVNPDNWKDVSVGAARDLPPNKAKIDGQDFIRAEVVVNDAETIEKLESKELCEVSMGYVCEHDETPGTTPDGEKYDRKQIKIRHNHLALLPKGQARAGGNARLMLDSKGHPTTEEKKIMPTIKIDGVEVEERSAAHISLLEKQISDAKSATEAAEKAKADAEEETEAAKAEAEEAKGEAEAAEKKTSPEEMEKVFKAAMAFRDEMREVVGDSYDFAGKTDRQVIEDAIETLGGEKQEAETSDAVASAYFRGLAKAAKKQDARNALTVNRTENKDDSKPRTVADAVKGAWKKVG